MIGTLRSRSHGSSEKEIECGPFLRSMASGYSMQQPSGSHVGPPFSSGGAIFQSGSGSRGCAGKDGMIHLGGSSFGGNSMQTQAAVQNDRTRNGTMILN